MTARSSANRFKTPSDQSREASEYRGLQEILKARKANGTDDSLSRG